MRIELDPVNKFFKKPLEVPMPRILLSLIMEGYVLSSNGLETRIFDWPVLHDKFSKEIAEKISPRYREKLIPALRRTDTPEFYIYSPRNGQYLGTFSVNPPY